MRKAFLLVSSIVMICLASLGQSPWPGNVVAQAQGSHILGPTVLTIPLTDSTGSSPWQASGDCLFLNGPWGFTCYEGANELGENFFKPNFDAQGWGQVLVPSGWQAQDAGSPVYPGHVGPPMVPKHVQQPCGALPYKLQAP